MSRVCPHPAIAAGHCRWLTGPIPAIVAIIDQTPPGVHGD